MTKDRITTIHDADAREIVRALKTAVAQIDMSLQDSEQSIESVVEHVVAAAGSLRSVQKDISSGDSAIGPEDLRESVLRRCEEAEHGLGQAMKALQFYDRLSQRCLHVQENLVAVEGVVQAPDLQHPSLWKSLHGKMRSIYSQEQERRIYDSIQMEPYDGEPKNLRANAASSSGSDIELF
ncbi:MAG: hypothetical protein AB8B81_01370 [Halioglobus sp.]